MTDISVSHVPLFEGVSEETIQQLFKRAQLEQHSPEIILFREGMDMPHLMYVILSGKVDLYKKKSRR